MMTIKVCEYIPNAFSSDQATVIRKVMEEVLSMNETITLDFEGIKRFTTLFFNFSTAAFITKLGPDVYKNSVVIKNLSSLGQSTYENSYNNAIKKYSIKDQADILDILQNPED